MKICLNLMFLYSKDAMLNNIPDFSKVLVEYCYPPGIPTGPDPGPKSFEIRIGLLRSSLA